MFRYGEKLCLEIDGKSHSDNIFVSLDGIKNGYKIDKEKIGLALQRRSPGKNDFSSPRKENDRAIFLSGFSNDFTDGTKITAEIKNNDAKSTDYESTKGLLRPAHADYTAYLKYGLDFDTSGGAHFSGRMTAPMVLMGEICRQILEQNGVKIVSHISEIHSVKDTPFDKTELTDEIVSSLNNADFPTLDSKAKAKMLDEIAIAKANGDSVGGVIECAVLNFPSGVGDALFSSIEGKISSFMFAIPAIKGIEFGSGFFGSTLYGSQNNDEFAIENGEIITKTNNCGGILGGISNGMPIVFKVAVKPTPSIKKKQNTVDIFKMENAKIKIEGRHDTCIVPRAVAVVEAGTAIALLDILMSEGKI